MEKCRFCGKPHGISPEGRDRIRAFREKYPWVTQADLARLFAVGDARMSEIIRKDAKRGGL